MREKDFALRRKILAYQSISQPNYLHRLILGTARLLSILGQQSILQNYLSLPPANRAIAVIWLIKL